MDDEFPDQLQMPGDASPVGREAALEDRRRIDPPERRALDRALAIRLDRLGANPWTAKITDMVDVDTGEAFHDIDPMIEHWLLAGPAKRRAAGFNAVFSAFCAQADTTGFRGYVLRPPLKKVPPGALNVAIRRLAELYGRVMANAKRDALAKPVAVFVHPRWDSDLNLWDLHLHCIADVASGMEDRFFLRLALAFSTPRSIGSADNMAAWANYSSGWVVDHRDVARWSDEALLEFWNLKAPQLIRKAGDFAAFARTTKGKAIRWEGGRVVIEDKQPRERRQKDRAHPSRREQQVGYAEVRIGGCRRRCAILRYDRAKRQGHPDQLEAALPRSRKESSTTTGSIPSTSIRQDSGRQAARRIRRRLAMWETIWPWGSPDRPPGPIRRRLVRAGVVIDPPGLRRPRAK